MQPSSNATRSLSSEIVGRSKLASVKPSMAPKHDARRSNAWVLILSLGLLQSAGWAQEPRLPGTIPPVTMPPINSAVVAPLNESNASTPRIIDVQIKGNQRVSKNKILEKLQTRPDRDFSPDLLQADVQELMLMKEFRNVRPYVAEQDEGVLVTFEVIEKPRVTQVNFIGNRAITNRALIKEAAIKEGDPLDLYTVRLAQQRLEDLYKRKGFPQTEVTVVEGDDEGHSEVTFLINEDQVREIVDVKFIGNSFVSGARLGSFIKSKPGWFAPVYRTRYSKEKLVSDRERLTAYYRNFGFFNAVIDTETRYSDDHSKVHLTFIISEGPRYKIRDVALAGNEIYTSDELFTLLELQTGEDFNAAEMTRDVNSLKDLYGSKGYINAQVKADPLFLDEPGLIDLVYKVEEGEQYRVGRINVHIGGDYGVTKQSVVLSRLDLRPGDIIDIRKIRESERRLAASGLFLAEPAMGQMPRIEIKPRENSFEDSVRAAGLDFRGQSPDGPVQQKADLDYFLPPQKNSNSTWFWPR
jgi:outer membrane protein insertion porin family